jgi:hypothetical protein
MDQTVLQQHLCIAVLKGLASSLVAKWVMGGS